MAEPVGFLITWTCYGTWLYGDERGSVDDEHNAYRTPYLPQDKRRIAGLRRRMRHPPFLLRKEARELITNTVEEHCRRRGWEFLAVNARSNHVHVVVGFGGVSPEMMMGEWKAWSSRRLRERGLAGPRQTVRTRHGSTRYVWKKRDLDSAVAYVVNGQDATRFRDSQG